VGDGKLIIISMTVSSINDTQLFPSLLPARFDSSIDHLHNALDRISSWMTANLLTLNSFKTRMLNSSGC